MQVRLDIQHVKHVSIFEWFNTTGKETSLFGAITHRIHPKINGNRSTQSSYQRIIFIQYPYGED